jgi:hypothetical protein
MTQRRRNPTPWLILAGGLAVVVGVIGLVVMLTSGGEDTSGPREVATAAAAAIEANNADGVQALACEQDDDDLVEDFATLGRGISGVESATVGDVVEEDDEEVLFELVIDYDNGPTVTPDLEIERESGNWCVSDVEYF